VAITECSDEYELLNIVEKRGSPNVDKTRKGGVH